MSKIIRLAVLAILTASTVSAIEITFKRFSRDGCNDYSNHIAEDTHLHDPYCKTFDEDEPAFYSFIVAPEDDQEEMYEKYCFVTVYDQEDCSGQAFAYGNMTEYQNQCADSPVPGRSVRVSCMDSQTTLTAAMPATTITRATLIEEDPHRTLTVDDPTEIITIPDATTILSTTLPSITGEPKDKKHHKGKHGKAHQDEDEDVIIVSTDSSNSTFDATIYPTTTMETITLVPASKETDEARRICKEFPKLDGCDDVLAEGDE